MPSTNFEGKDWFTGVTLREVGSVPTTRGAVRLNVEPPLIQGVTEFPISYRPLNQGIDKL